MHATANQKKAAGDWGMRALPANVAILAEEPAAHLAIRAVVGVRCAEPKVWCLGVVCRCNIPNGVRERCGRGVGEDGHVQCEQRTSPRHITLLIRGGK